MMLVVIFLVSWWVAGGFVAPDPGSRREAALRQRAARSLERRMRRAGTSPQR